MNLKDDTLPMSLFGRYIKERDGKDIVEDDEGFATYKFTEDGQCYLEDLYVIPDLRGPQPSGKGTAARYADKVCEIAKKKGCITLYGSVVPSKPNASVNIQTLFKYGFKLKSSMNDFILFEKELI